MKILMEEHGLLIISSMIATVVIAKAIEYVNVFTPIIEGFIAGII